MQPWHDWLITLLQVMSSKLPLQVTLLLNNELIIWFIYCGRFLYGDQAKYFDAEIKPRIKHKKKGTVSMANNGDNLHGSQVRYDLA